MMARALLLAMLLLGGAAVAQGLDFTQGGPVEVTARDGIEWRQQEQVVIARGDARAVRDGVTIEADTLLARYRQRNGQAGQTAAPASGGETPLSGGEIWRLEAEGNVRISSATDRAQGDRAVYDMDQAVMVLTGRDLWLATPDNRITARDSLEYWTQRRMAVARGEAKVESNDGRIIRADTLVGYFAEDAPPGARQTAARGAETNSGAQPETGRLERVEAFNNVEIRTATEVVRGQRGVYSPVTGMARLLGNVRITRGDNHLNGQEAIVNLRTGVARLVSAPGQRVQGLIVPQEGQTVPDGQAAQPGTGTQQRGQER